MKTIHETSCGVILVTRSPEGLKYLLLLYPGGHWDFPKGHVEKQDENFEATARRELMEETGIQEIQLTPYPTIDLHYSFKRGSKMMVRKMVHFFLGMTEQREVTISHEHQSYAWLTYDEAMKQLTFENAKEVLKKAHDLRKHVES